MIVEGDNRMAQIATQIGIITNIVEHLDYFKTVDNIIELKRSWHIPFYGLAVACF
jgi:UDP-N-acetylmuramate-alanine ligase